MQGVNDITCLKGLLDKISRNVKNRKEGAIQHTTKWRYAFSLRRERHDVRRI